MLTNMGLRARLTIDCSRAMLTNSLLARQFQTQLSPSSSLLYPDLSFMR